MEKRRPSILEVNYLFMAVALFLFTLSLLLGFEIIKLDSIYKESFIIQYLIILLPMMIFIRLKKYSFKKVLRLNKINLKQALLSIVIPVFAYPIGLFFNYMGLIIINIAGGELRVTPIPIPETTSLFVISLVLFAVTPGICEEIMFRGVIQSAYEKIGIRKAMLITGLLFGLFHFNVQNFLGPAFLGMMFSYMVYKTGSIYTSMIAHATNNAIALIILKVANTLEKSSPELQQMQNIDIIPETKVLLVGFVFITMMAVTSLVIVYFLFKSLNNSDKSEKELIAFDDSDSIVEKMTFVHIIPILVVVTMFIATTLIYFGVILG